MRFRSTAKRSDNQQPSDTPCKKNKKKKHPKVRTALSGTFVSGVALHFTQTAQMVFSFFPFMSKVSGSKIV